MKVVILQGNPGSEYSKTRHNVAWIIADNLVDASEWKKSTKFKALIANCNQAIFVKPETFYNQTGQTAAAIKKFYKLDSSDFLAIHDDTALDFGVVRTRSSGSGGGNNGINSLNSHLGDHYPRIRIGIKSDLLGKIKQSDFVLGKFNKDDINTIEKSISLIVKKYIDDFINDSFQETTEKIIK